MSSSSHAAVRYSMEQALSMVMDELVFYAQSTGTVISGRRWLWTISHQMYLLLIVTVVQFETFIVDFIMSELQTSYAKMRSIDSDSKIKL